MAPGEFFLDARAQHLDGDVAALGGDGAVDLGDRGGADRLRIDTGENCSTGPPSACSIAALIAGKGSGGSRPCNWSKFAAAASPTRSGRVASAWPELDRGRADLLQGRGIIGSGRHGGGRSARRGTRRRTSGGVSGSRSIPCSAPCRASVRPHLSRRHRWVGPAVKSSTRRRDCDQAAEDRLDAGRLKPASPIIALNASMRGKRRIDSTR